jgi:hypothetical protein
MMSDSKAVACGVVESSPSCLMPGPIPTPILGLPERDPGPLRPQFRAGRYEGIQPGRHWVRGPPRGRVQLGAVTFDR